MAIENGTHGARESTAAAFTDDLTLVFDLDGTLVDTAPDLINATNHTLSLKGLAPVRSELIRPAISFGARVMIETSLSLHKVTLPTLEIDGLFEAFLDYYVQNIAIESRPFPGIMQMIARYRERGTRLAVCTNKREDMSRSLLAALKMDDMFHAIAGRDTFAVLKPDPGHLTGAIDLARGHPKRAIMVGDSQTDIATAQAAGIPVIGVTFGYSDPPMEDLHPTTQIRSYDEFDAAVLQIVERDFNAT